MSRAAYVKIHGSQCPFCYSNYIEGGHTEVDAAGAFQEIKCLTCGREWIDEYKLTGYNYRSS